MFKLEGYSSHKRICAIIPKDFFAEYVEGEN